MNDLVTDNFTADWGTITPEFVSGVMNFSATSDWNYCRADKESMAAKQTEGVAHLWNLLNQHSLALLADEVGMGKTFQALGVASLLWKMKPDAKVLVLAPNRDICMHWRREFDSFVRHHYRLIDHSVKNSADGGPVPSVFSCHRLPDLVRAVESGAAHFYLMTVTSFSNLVPREEKKGDKVKVAKRVAKSMYTRVMAALEGHGFDLVIVDEAHYLRNVNGGSQKVAAARAFLGKGEEAIGKKYILLTATPSHSRLSDVRNTFSYFLDMDCDQEERTNDAADVSRILRKYGLRRLRLMEGNGGRLYGKRHYRSEQALASSFKEEPNAELFFAAYQKRLVSELRKAKENKSLLYGYLEGFESVGRYEEMESSEGGNDEDLSNGSNDFAKARDTELLRALTGQYWDHFKQFPEHPKYGSLVTHCVPKALFDGTDALHDNKHLIFVRRIPSVRELTQRLNAGYDELLVQRICQAWGYTQDDQAVRAWRRSNWSGEGLAELVAGRSGEGHRLPAEGGPDDEDEAAAEELDDEVLGSRVSALFVKKDKGKQTDCANVRQRFIRPENVLSLFLEPSRDYLCGGYTHFRKEGSEKSVYATAARFQRFEAWASSVDRSSSIGGEEPPDHAYESEMKTVWSLVVPHLSLEHREKLTHWSVARPAVAENFGNYLKAGFLFASPVVVELYCWFVQFHREKNVSNAQELYRKFVEWVRPRIPKSLLLQYFEAALETFESLCGKVIDHGLEDWSQEWRTLKRLTSPARFASGQNSSSRQSLILGFNSPFYPNVLVSTSVLQEGVNLHLNCHQVHHYGLAGSPGDNEQRIGRVDRLFGCVNSRLKTDSSATLGIHYPYLKDSLDEDQLASFVERKYHVEEQMDACIQAGFSDEVDISTSVDWQNFLRKPVSRDVVPVKDPYEALIEGLPSPSYRSFDMHEAPEILEHLRSQFLTIIDTETEELTEVDGVVGDLFLIDPIVERDGFNRRQPIIVRKMFSPGFSALVPGTAYVLSLISPVASKGRLREIAGSVPGAISKVGEFVEALAAKYPLVRCTVNESAGNSHFYMSARVDLALFASKGELAMLSRHEIKAAFEDLKNFSDELEYSLFEGRQDLSRSDVEADAVVGGSTRFGKKVSSNRGNSSLQWISREGANGRVECLSSELSLDHIEAALRNCEVEARSSDAFHQSCQLNHYFPFVQFSPRGGKLQVSLCYPEDDLQPKERELVEKWFGYVLSRCK